MPLKSPNSALMVGMEAVGTWFVGSKHRFLQQPVGKTTSLISKCKIKEKTFKKQKKNSKTPFQLYT